MDINLHQTAKSLPAYAIADAVNEKLLSHNTLVITAPPGAGKSTLLPLTALSVFPEGKVLVLEPRRLAARQIAERMAFLLGESVGETVGYRVRFESKVSKQTRIEVLTEGILTRMLVDDPTLDGVNAILFDEFHERSLNSDVALALSRESQQVVRPDLKLVIMSATIDASSICAALDAPLVESEGRMYPVETLYCGDLQWADNRNALAELARTVLNAHRENEGDILVFLPGESEIRRCQELLGDMGQTRIYPLYGMLSPQEQRLAIAPSAPGERKIVLATSIAETSLTIEGVRAVVDSGLCRKQVFDPRTGLSSLQTVPISMDMANQRRGRAGRVAPGVCYRLWSSASECRREECRTPEILEADLSSTLLDSCAWGESRIERLPWLTLPPKVRVVQARELLQLLGAIDENGQITPHGRSMVQLPCHPRIAQMLLSARTPEEQSLASDLAAILEAGGSGLPLKNAGADISVYLDELLQARKRKNHQWHRICLASDYFYNITKRITLDKQVKPIDSKKDVEIGLLVALAYPERIARVQSGAFGTYQLASGEKATLDASDDLSAYEWIAVAHMNAGGNGRIYLGAPLSPTALTPFAQERDNVAWDNKQGTVIARRERRIGVLLLDSKPIHEDNRELITQVICQAAHKWGTSMLDFNEDVLNMQRRVASVAKWHPDLELPDFSTDAVLLRTEEWLPFYLDKATTTAELKKIDLTQALWGLLTYEQQLQVDRLAPTHFVFPSGRRIKIEYRQGAEFPIIRVRLQECFGLNDTPRIDDGRQPVLMELLSPGFKPVQLTQDLKNFWKETYFEVRKELRRRYPKHAWPEDPTAVTGRVLDNTRK